jgi:hypothetical protein
MFYKNTTLFDNINIIPIKNTQVIYYSTILITGLIFDILGLIIGSNYQNAICYKEKYMLSLSSWLVTITSISILTFILVFLTIILTIYNIITDRKITHNYYMITTVLVIISIIFLLIMNIIGIIEIIYQFDACKYEVEYVCIIILIILCINFMGAVCSFIEDK